MTPVHVAVHLVLTPVFRLPATRPSDARLPAAFFQRLARVRALPPLAQTADRPVETGGGSGQAANRAFSSPQGAPAPRLAALVGGVRARPTSIFQARRRSVSSGEEDG